jgi:hypothetical protein
MNAAMIVVQYPTVESVPPAQRNEEIQALSVDRSPPNVRKRHVLGRSGRRPQYGTPMAATAWSNSREKMLSRSWMRKPKG